MPWQNNSGGSGGPWGGGGDGPQNPWGQGGGGGGGGGGQGGGPDRNSGPDFEDFLRRSQERLRARLPGSGEGGPNWLWFAGAAVGLWIIFTSIYRVDAQERGVITRFGRYVETTNPGMHLKFPDPIDKVVKPKVEQVSSIDIGSAEGGAENLMLTGDQNIIDIAYTVRWKIRSAERYLFQLADPEKTIREVAESAMRSEIARASLNNAIGPQRAQIAEQVRVRIGETLDSYNAGIDVVGVDIKQADPPAAVDAAFKDVSAAQQNAQGYINQSRAYAQTLIAQAQGEAAAFDAVYGQYRLAPEVTRKRMYLETMENILSKVDKTVVGAPGVTPYLPLPEIKRRAGAAAAQETRP